MLALEARAITGCGAVGAREALSCVEPAGRIGRLILQRALQHTDHFRLDDSGKSENPIALLLAESPVVLSQMGKSVSLAPGEWTLFRADRPACLDQGAASKISRLPADSFFECGLSLRRLLLHRFSRAQSINRVVFSFFTALFEETAGLSDADGQELSQATLHVLKKALLDADNTRSQKTVLLTRIREFIDWHIRDPQLSPDQIARALNCTPRNIHRAFARETETLGQYILRRRLERCRDDLSETRNPRSVTEIAFSWGFNNAAHFSRVFKNQFGCSPSAWRLRQWPQAENQRFENHTLA